MQERSSTNLIVIHAAATKPTMDIGFAEIDQWHKARGWNGCGYHFIIRRDGTVEQGRHLREQGAHVAGHNHNSVGVCLVGGVDANMEPEENYTSQQWGSLYWVVQFCKLAYPEAQVLGHRDLPNVAKACPSFDAKEWAINEGFNDR